MHSLCLQCYLTLIHTKFLFLNNFLPPSYFSVPSSSYVNINNKASGNLPAYATLLVPKISLSGWSIIFLDALQCKMSIPLVDCLIKLWSLFLMLMDVLLSCFQHASLVLMTFILRYFYSLYTFASEILKMGGRNYRVWWPQQLLTATSSSGLLLFGWFMDSVDSIDIVIATAIPSAKMMALPLQTNIEVREMLECYLCTFSV